MAKAGYLGTQYNFIAGALAGVTSSMIMYPLELTRTRMAMRGEMSKFGLREIIKNTYK
jgi:Mitochondrial carrier protein